MIVPIDLQINCIKREIARRKKIYPELIDKDKLTTADTVLEVSAMQGVLETLTTLRGIVK